MLNLINIPVRELAFQISDQFTVIGAPLDIRTTVVVGGMDMTSQMIALNSRPHVVVATPGRLVDLLNEAHGEWSLGRVKFLVLDEADRLLGTAFASELTAIFARLPDSRQTCLFTATLTPTIEALALAPPRPGKEKPYVYRDSDTSSIETVETLTQQYILCPSHVREVYLYHLLRNPPESILHLRRNPSDPDSTGIDDVKSRKRSIKAASRGKRPKIKDDDLTPDQPPPTIIFVQKSGTAAYLETMLKRLGFRSTSLHSQLTQQRRLASLGLFRSYFVPILICTDVGARGLDMDNVGMVINWDLPTNPKDMVTIKGDDGQLLQMPADAAPADAVVQDRGESFQSAEETYVHRVGRTARMGRGGIALSFVTERRWDEETIRRIEDKIHTKLTEYPMEEETVLEKLNLVSGAKRLALMELERSEHGKKKELHKKLKEKKQRRSAFQE
ncbi:putative RNA helicase [Tulasnella sp. 403]|nr:putative RNA helicase [Tulasnella sp. 403]